MQSSIVSGCDDFHSSIPVQIGCHGRWQDVCEFQGSNILIKTVIPAERASLHIQSRTFIPEHMLETFDICSCHARR